MANENKKINELVTADDEPAAELDTPTVRQAFAQAHEMAPAESDDKTYDAGNGLANTDDGGNVTELPSDLRTRADKIERLQYDIEQLHAKWLGLEAELEAREEATANLAIELTATKKTLAATARRLSEREDSLASLQAELRESEHERADLEKRLEKADAASHELASAEELASVREQLDQYEGLVAGQNAALAALRSQQERTEAYADELRRQFSDLGAEADRAVSEGQRLREALAAAEERIGKLDAELDSTRSSARAAEERVSEMEREHERELRQLRFELDEAVDTIAEHETISEQLASDLVDTRGFKQELERMLSVNSEKSQGKIDELEDQVALLEATIEEYEEELEAKGEAIDCLIAELSRNGSEFDSIGEIEHVIHDLDDRMSERIDERRAPPADRVARLLVGRIDKQDLRFPLFKNRLTIGRTRQNDIQLKADHVSRRHAVVVTEGDATRVIDWGSKNGVYVNSQRVKEHFLKNGDILAIGTAKFRYEERPKRDA